MVLEKLYNYRGLAWPIALISIPGFLVFWGLYAGWLRLQIFSKLTQEQTFMLMLLFLVFVFVVLLLALSILLMRQASQRAQAETSARVQPDFAMGREQKEPQEPDDFLRRVRQAAEKREPDARLQRLEQPLPHIRVNRHSAEFEQQEEFTIYALDAVPDRVALDRYYKQVVRPLQRLYPDALHWLVHSGETASSELKERARAHKIVLQTFSQYQGMLQLAPYVEDQTERLSRNQDYPPEQYIPQGLQWEQGSAELEADNALDTVKQWLLQPDKGHFIMVLADFGTGKTFLLRELARQLAEIPGAPYPVLIEMRSLAMREREKNLDSLISQQLARADVDYRPSKFRYMLAQGRVVLLFDAYDELALRVTYEQADEYLDLLLEAADGEFAKVVVSSRRQHFRSDHQVKDAMRRKIEAHSRRRIARLKKFDSEQVQRFLALYFKSDQADKAARYFDYIEHIQNLLGLSETPRMLKFIAALPEEEFQAVRRRNECISAAGLYRSILEHWLRGEQVRGSDGNKDDIELQHRWEAVRLMARHLWKQAAVSVDAEELERQLSRIKTDLQRLCQVHKLGSGTLLVRDQEDRFGFVHQSVLEWLVAEQAAGDPVRADELLAANAMSELMVEFYIDLVGREPAQAWAERTERNPAAGDHARKNARSLLQRLDIKLTVTRYVGKELAGEDLSGQALDNADFTSAKLDGALFTGGSLKRASFSAAKLRNADFSNAQLAGADFSGADLRGAVWEGATLDGVNWNGAYGRPFRHTLNGGGQGPELILLPGETFRMGGDGKYDGKPIHEVTPAAFAIGLYPVTRAQFEVFVTATDYVTEAERSGGAYVWTGKDWDEKTDASWRNPYIDQGPEHPVVCVSWHDAVAYCEWLSRETGETYRLPSEAQWEYACRAGGEGAYCFGDDEERLSEFAWYYKNADMRTHSVGGKKPNAWGLYDVHGNVFEWCGDQWHDSYVDAPTDGSAWFGGGKETRLLRGGAWSDYPVSCRAAFRSPYLPAFRSSLVGFRVLSESEPRTL